ncbi:cyclic nucleotide-binding domain-containing protein [Reinekea forsetii]|nr:cyclic nucleotide-binding domain-containing protein [Reinekea forsetii]
MKRTSQVPVSKIIQLMKKIPIFDAFTSEDRAQMAEHAQIYIANADEAIIERDAKDNCFYILLSGEARVLLRQKDVAPLATIEPGDMFGEIGFALGTPRSTWVLANQLSALLRVDHKLLDALDHALKGKVKDQIIHKMANTISALNSR